MGTLIQTFPDGGSGGGASAGMIADEFSTSVDYAVGDLVIYDKTLYKFTSAHSAGAWDPSDVTDDVTVDSELKLKQNLSDTFNGTLQQWEALPLATKLTYKYANITNDPTEQLEIVSADIDIENHVVHLDGDELVGLNGIWKTQGEYGVKNLIPYPYYDGTSKTITGITYTVNSDGSITANGTSTGNAIFYMVFRQQPHNLKAGRYKISGCPSGGSIDTYYIWMGFWNGSSNTNSVYETGNGATIDVLETSENLQLVIECVVKSGSNMDGKIFKPMLRVAADTDDTYRPYAKTNKQLTDEISGNTSDIDEIDERLDNTTTAVTGNPISITGLKSNQLAKDPIITFEPIQAGSGDPSPSNVRAISGYDKIEVLSLRKNVCPYLITDFEYITNLDAYASKNGDILTATIYSSAFNAGVYAIFSFIPEYAGKTCSYSIYAKANKNVNALLGLETKGQKEVELTTEWQQIKFENILFDNNQNAFTIYSHSEECEIQVKNLMIQVGPTCSEYEPCNPLTNIQFTLGQTIYGGTLDVEKGILTVTHTLVTLSGLTFSASTETENYRKWATYSEQSTYPAGDNLPLSNIAPKGTSTTAIYYANEKGVSWVSGYLNVVVDKSVTQETMNALTLQLCYAIDNPYTIQLTPHEISLLKDYAYVSTNGTNIAFDYHNGEMASLADVAQLGETINLLGDRCGTETIGISDEITNDSQYHTLQLSKAWNTFRIINVYVYCATWGSAYLSINIPTIAFSMQSQETKLNFGDSTDSQAISIKKGTNTNELSLQISQTGAFDALKNIVYVTGIY